MGVGTLIPPLLELRDVACAPPGRPGDVLKGVSLTLRPGEIGALLGGNGAGKSTLLRATAGLWPLRAGTVLLDGVPVAGWDARRIALVLDDPAAQFVTATVRRELEFVLEYAGCSGAEVDGPVARALAAHDLERLADRDPLTLSAGEQQGALLAAALLLAPRVLLLDDPFLYLDPDHALAALDTLRRLVASGRVGGAIVAGHDADLAAECDRVGVIDGGTLRAWGAPGEVLRAALPPEVAPPLAVAVDRALEPLGLATPGDDLRPEAAARRVARAARR